MEEEDQLDMDIEDLARALDEEQARQASELLEQAPIRLTRARSMLGVTGARSGRMLGTAAFADAEWPQT